MEKSYWINRWQRGETAFHQTEVEPALIAHFSSLAPTTVLVPLCGKTLDLKWLASRGHQVYGIELSEMACTAFFDENQIAYNKTQIGKIPAYQGGNVTLVNGDFFAFDPNSIPEIGALYDRAALIALPPDVRVRYSQRITEILERTRAKNPRFLQIVLERKPHDVKGPPFSVKPEEIQNLYGKNFEIEPVSREEIKEMATENSMTEECVYLLSLK